MVDTGAQRGAAKHPSEIVTHTGNSHNMIGALGYAKILPGIRLQKEAVILHESYGHRNPTSLVKDLKAAGIPVKHLQRYLHAHKWK